MEHHYKIKKAFTLAEVLITLGVIGIVAAMTLPTLIQKQQEKIAVTRLKNVYSIFSQAYLRAVSDNGPIESWDIGTQDSASGALELYDYFRPYLLKVRECKTNAGCFYDGKYKALNNPVYAWQPSTHPVYAKGILANGVSFIFWSAGSGCKLDYSANHQGHYLNTCGIIHVDINGYSAPNQAGIDYFDFVITKGGIVPAGRVDYKSVYGSSCKFKDTSNKNGTACTAWVIANGNMDYRRRDISSEWK